MRILVTGATGFVGSELTRHLLLAGAAERVWVLVRPSAGLSAEERWERVVRYWERYVAVPSARELAKVRVVAHDLETTTPVPIDPAVERVVHAAASTDLGLPLGPGRRVNLHPTQRMLAAARRLPRLERFLHVSTAYVCGRRRGTVHEDDPPVWPLRSPYEQTKLEAEDAVRASDLPWTIARPSIIVGRSDDGYVLRMKVLYSVWRTWLLGLIPRAPLDPEAWVDLVPVDYVVEGLAALVQHPEALHTTIHLASGAKRVSPKTIMHAAVTAYGVPPVPLSPPWVVDVLRLPFVRPFLSHGMRQLLDLMHWHLPYLGLPEFQLSTERADRLLAPRGVVCPSFESYGARIFGFCKDTAWGKRPRQEVLCSA